MTNPPICDERARLLEEYNNAVLDAARSARKLAELAGSATRGADEKNRANVRVKKTRESFDQHASTHGCGAR